MKFKEIMHQLSPGAKASIVMMLTQLIQKGFQVVTTPVLTRLLNTTEYGQVALFLSWYEIFSIFTSLCLSRGVFNNGMLDFREDRDVFSYSLYALSFLSSCIIGIVITVFCAYIWNFIRLPIPIIAFMFILLAFEEALALWSVRQRFEYKYRALGFITVALAVLSPLCGLIGICLFDNHAAEANIIGSRLVFLLVYLAMLGLLAWKAKGRIDTAYWRYALKFNLPIIPHYLSQHILNHMDRIQIAAILGEASAGIYSLAYSGGAVVKLFWTSINSSLIPWTYEKCECKEFEQIDKLTRLLVFGYALICLAVMFLAPEIIRFLAPGSYYEGIYVIPSVITGVYFSALYFIFANIVYYYKQPKYVMLGSCASAAVNVILNAIFIPRFGYLVAGYTTAVAYLIQVIIDFYAMRRVSPDKIYDMRYMVGISIMVTFIGIILNFIYGYTLLRYGLFVLLSMLVLLFIHKHAGSIIKTIVRSEKPQ